MKTINAAVKAFIQDEEGVTAIEYGLIAALIASALVTGLAMVTGGLNDAWQYIKDQIATATT
ncbi:Flp family type IVb pilin [Massilia arenosa]|uniref:Flp family type IVb pilin n=1 Tax=Zemynaea arenosa TaxID=2561931 RepID=A0A4Y9ST49_9BURK|nr:Flp family type IVb pilin [Massilia arenosa]TFW29655.1 Flp family type IVb pilin [Massilia arenosa]